MTIDFSQMLEDDEWRFQSSHWVHAPVAVNRHLVTLTGIVIIDFEGTGGAWRRDRLNLGLRFPTAFFPPGKWFQVEHWAPFVTINAIYNKEVANHAGWAVDKFGGPGAKKISNSVGIWADIAVRDVDGYLFRVGYTLTVSGTFTEPPPPPG